MTLVIVTEDFIVGSLVDDRQTIEMICDLSDPSKKFLSVLSTGFSAFALDLLAEGLGDDLSDTPFAPSREFARELLGLRILDVESHREVQLASLGFLPSS